MEQPRRNKPQVFSNTAIIASVTSQVVELPCMHVDIRVPPPFTAQQMFDEVNRKIKQYQTINPNVLVKVKIEDLTDPIEVKSKSFLVRTLSWAIRKVRSNTPTLIRKTGTGDVNALGNALKTPVVTYGLGDSSLDHTPNEHVDIQEYLDNIQVYREAIIRLVELHKKRK